jgi:Tol biopolymer transport system component
LNPQLPEGMESIITKLLEKDRMLRYQTAADLKADLQRLKRDSHSARTGATLASAPPVSTVRTRSQRTLPWALAAVGIISTVILAFVAAHYILQPKPEEGAIRFSVSPPENVVFHPLGGFARVSPDGRQLAFVGVSKDGKKQLWIRSFSELAAKALQGTEGAEWPFWSPDSRYLGFYAEGKLKKVAGSGGPVQTLCDASAGGGAWNRDGVIVFTNQHILYRVSEGGGAPTMVVKPDAVHQELDYFPQFLPDGRHFLFCAIRTDVPKGSTEVGSLGSKEIKFLLRSVDSTALYAPPGYLLYLQDGVLMARRFDVKRLDFTADAVSIAEDVGSNPLYPYLYSSVSSNGVLAYQTPAISATNQLFWFSRKGAKLESVGEAGVYSNPAISPDGARLAVGLLGSGTRTQDIWVYDLRRGTGSPLTFDPANSLDAAWSPDGKHIMFTSEHKGIRGIYQKSADGLGNTELAFANKVQVGSIDDWSPDSRYALYEDAATRTNLWVLPLFGQRKPFAFVQGEFNTLAGQFSPNGRYVAYTSDESGRPEVYVQTFPEHLGKWQVSTSGGTEPMWRPDGNELFYLKPDDTLVSVNVKTSGGEFQAGIPKPLFQVKLITGRGRNRYVVSPDGQRFLMIVATGEANPSPITVVVNWPALLKKT